MSSLRFLLQKEFNQIRRNPAILRMMFIMPVIQLIVLPFAANYEVKEIKLAIVDQDHSSYTRECTQKIISGKYFNLSSYNQSYGPAIIEVEQDKADLILTFPPNFEKDLIRESEASVFLAVNGINGVKASLGAAYLQMILRDYNQDIRSRLIQFPRFNPESLVEISYRFFYNQHLLYPVFMVPGILTLLLTMIGMFLASLNIVREKEIGTIEQINVTPIKKYHFILGKLIPFWLMSQVVLTIGLVVSRVVYGIHVGNHLELIYLFSAVYMLAVLGLGLLISTYSNTQQQAVLVSFFLMMVFILLSGLYTSIDSMPFWAKVITWFNPVAYFVAVMRMVVIKGSGFWDIASHLAIIFAFALFLISWAILNYRKRT
jgi:ABC-2 type transport system permease protein